MIGWRLGWVCGHERIVQALADVKDNSDSGQFIAIQKAAVTALDDDSIPLQIRDKYRRRMAKLVQALTACGFVCQMPGGSYFLYTRAPRGVDGGATFDAAEAASQYLITQHSIVTVPWPVPAVLRHLRSGGRGCRGCFDGRDRKAFDGDSVGVLRAIKPRVPCVPRGDEEQ